MARTDKRTSENSALTEETSGIEPLVEEWLTKIRIDPKTKKAITSGVLLANGEGKCSPEALQLLVSLCYVPRSMAREPGDDDSWEYLHYLEPIEYRKKIKWFHHVANDDEEFIGFYFWKLRKPAGTARAISEISSWLDPENLSATLERLFFEDNLNIALVALCRFGNESAIDRVTAVMPEWEAAGATAKKDYYIAKCALLHSRTDAALRYFRKWDGIGYCYHKEICGSV